MTQQVKNDDREKLPAEKKFDQRVYGGISYFAQAATGTGLMYWIKHAGGRPIYDKMANWLGPNFISKITNKRGPAAIASADYWITVTTMVTVGTLFVAPVKWLENIKTNIVKKWTKQENDAREAAGNPLSPEEKAHQDKLMAELEAEPKQTWRSLLTARVASLIPVYATLPLLGDFNKAMEGGFQNGAKAAAKTVGLKKIAESDGLRNLSGLVFYDGFYSIISAGGLYIYSHFICPPKDKPKAEAQIAPEAEPEKIDLRTDHASSIKRKPQMRERAESFTDNVMASKMASIPQVAV